jgi:hypothetical protein
MCVCVCVCVLSDGWLSVDPYQDFRSQEISISPPPASFDAFSYVLVCVQVRLIDELRRSQERMESLSTRVNQLLVAQESTAVQISNLGKHFQAQSAQVQHAETV